MTLEETRQAAAVMLAFAEGKKIEFRERGSSKKWWLIFGDPEWMWCSVEYRVAPERWSGKIWVHKATGNVRDELHFGGVAPIEGGWQLIEAKEVEP